MPVVVTKKLVLFAALTMAACASLVPNKYLITKERLVGTIQKRFPFHKSNANNLYSGTLGLPRLTLIPSQNRVRFEGDFNGEALVFKLDGHYTFSSELQYDASQHAILMREPRLDTLQLVQGPEYEDILKKLLNQMIKEFAKKEPIYVFKPEELVFLGNKILIEDISVTMDGVVLKIHALK